MCHFMPTSVMPAIHCLSMPGMPMGGLLLANSGHCVYIMCMLSVFVALAVPSIRLRRSLLAFLSLSSSVSREVRMSAWKVLFIVAFGCVCLAFALATIIVPMTVVESGYRWAWLAGLVFATVCMGTLFAIFLHKADRALRNNDRRYK